MKSNIYMIFIILVSTCVSMTRANTIYVDCNGGGDYLKVQEGINAALNGDTVLVAPCTYYENIDFNGKNIVLISELGPDTTVINAGGSGITVNLTSGEDTTTVIEGFTITGAAGMYHGGGIHCENASPAIRNNIIRNNSSDWGAGVYCVNGNSRIEWNVIEENDAYGGAGIRLGQDFNGSVVGNIIRKNTSISGGTGLRTETGSSPLIANNLIVENHGGSIVTFTGSSSSPKFFHNTVDNNEGSNVVQIHGGASPEVWNNIVSNNIGIGIANSGGAGFSIAFNNVWNNSEGDYYNCSSDSGGLSADPLFSDPTNGDYHLSFQSPCIDSAADIGIYSDFDGESRPMGNGFDIGFDEYFIEGIYDLLLIPTGPIIVPQGGFLEFNARIINNSEQTVSGDYWLTALLPDSSEILIPDGLLNYSNPFSGQIFPFGFVEISNRLYIHPRVDIGSYQLIGRIGKYPDVISDEETFGFQVIE